MDLVRIGNHIISPRMLDFCDVLTTARTLEAQLRELEYSCEESKARRTGLRKQVSRLDKLLVSQRAEEERVKEASRKLSKTWLKHYAAFDQESTIQLFKPMSYKDDDPFPQLDSVFTCSTTQAATAFDGYTERYQDSYTFAEPVWGAPGGAQTSSLNDQEARSIVDDIPSSPSIYDNRTSFTFSFPLGAAADNIEGDEQNSPLGQSDNTRRERCETNKSILRDISRQNFDENSVGRKRSASSQETDSYGRRHYKKAKMGHAVSGSDISYGEEPLGEMDSERMGRSRSWWKRRRGGRSKKGGRNQIQIAGPCVS